MNIKERVEQYVKNFESGYPPVLSYQLTGDMIAELERLWSFEAQLTFAVATLEGISKCIDCNGGGYSYEALQARGALAEIKAIGGEHA